MIKYALKKLLPLVASLFLVATITFFLMHLVPGDPFTEEQALPAEVLAALKRHFHLDEPLFSQYLAFLKGAFTFDFGPSIRHPGRLCSEIILEALPPSLILGLQAILIALPCGALLGSLSALYRGRWQDGAILVLAILGISVPGFLLATFLQYLFAIKLSLFPVARWGSFAHTILPTLALAALPTAFIARLMKTSMSEVMEQDFILMAKAKGLTTFQIVWRHLLRNSLLPVVTYLGPLLASILTGSFVVEKIFGIPGLGQWFVLSVMNRDYTLIMALTLFYSALLLFFVYLVDIVYSLLDPRIAHE